jgi:hypothetical protein
MALDTSAVKITPAEVKSLVASYMLAETKTPTQMKELISSYEVKCERIDSMINDPMIPAELKKDLKDKKLRILKKYMVLQEHDKNISIKPVEEVK